MPIIIGLCWAALCTLAACDDTTPGTPEDVFDAEVDATDTESDAPAEVAPPDTGPELPEEIILRPDCNRNGFVINDGRAQRYLQDRVSVFHGTSSLVEPLDRMDIELWATPSQGVFTLRELPYKDCETCVLIYAGCANGTCEKHFLAYTGTVTINAWSSQRLSGHLSNVRLREVQISAGSFATTWVHEGDHWCIELLAFDAAF